MKLKYLYLFVVCFLLGISNIYASSIEYNLTIDDSTNFIEKNIYVVNENEMDKSGNYDFMTSIVKDKVYFNEDRKVEYTKKKTKSNGVYTVILSNKYTSSFLTGNRIMKECFSKYDLDNNETNISIKTTSPFYCYSRADSITINIKTNLNVVNHNAQSVNNNVYTWIPKNENFSIEFEITPEQVDNNSPMDDITEEDSNSETGSDFDDEQVVEDISDEKTKSNSISGIVIAIIFVILSIIGIIVAIILKNKKNQLNKI